VPGGATPTVMESLGGFHAAAQMGLQKPPASEVSSGPSDF